MFTIIQNTQGINGVEYFTDVEGRYTNSRPNSFSSDPTLEFDCERGISHQFIEDSDLNFYLIDASDLREQVDKIQQTIDQSCLNCLVILNHNSIMETASEKLKKWITQMDSFLPLPNSQFHDNNVPDLIHQNESAYWYIRGISSLIVEPGLNCIDFSDVRTVMMNMGMTVIATSFKSGDDRVNDALESIVSLPIFKTSTVFGSCNILVNLTAGVDIKMHEFEAAMSFIYKFYDDNITFIVGTVVDTNMKDGMLVTVITGQEVVLVSTKTSGSNMVNTIIEDNVVMNPEIMEGSSSSFLKHEFSNNSTDANEDDYEFSDIPMFLRQDKD